MNFTGRVLIDPKDLDKDTFNKYLTWLGANYDSHWDYIINNTPLPKPFTMTPAYYGKASTVVSIEKDLGKDFFSNKEILELGARGSFWGCYISNSTNKVVMTDNFLKWEDCGTIEFWKAVWDKFSDNKVDTQTVDCTNIAFEDNKFDVVSTISVVEHLVEESELVKSFKEAYRVLKPGGLYIVDTDMVDGIDPKWFGFQNFFTPTYLNKLASAEGFKTPSMFTISKDDLKSHHPLDVWFCCGLMYFIKE